MNFDELGCFSFNDFIARRDKKGVEISFAKFVKNVFINLKRQVLIVEAMKMRFNWLAVIFQERY